MRILIFQCLARAVVRTEASPRTKLVMSRREAVDNELNSLKAWCGELEERQN